MDLSHQLQLIEQGFDIGNASELHGMARVIAMKLNHDKNIYSGDMLLLYGGARAVMDTGRGRCVMNKDNLAMRLGNSERPSLVVSNPFGKFYSGGAILGDYDEIEVPLSSDQVLVAVDLGKISSFPNPSDIENMLYCVVANKSEQADLTDPEKVYSGRNSDGDAHTKLILSRGYKTKFILVPRNVINIGTSKLWRKIASSLDLELQEDNSVIPDRVYGMQYDKVKVIRPWYSVDASQHGLDNLHVGSISWDNDGPGNNYYVGVKFSEGRPGEEVKAALDGLSPWISVRDGICQASVTGEYPVHDLAIVLHEATDVVKYLQRLMPKAEQK